MYIEFLEKNGLKLHTVPSTVSIINEIQDLTEKLKDSIPKDAFAILFLTNKVIVGRYSNGEFYFHDNKKIDINFLLKARIFNSEMELLVWKAQGKLNGRFRVDGIGKSQHAVDAYQQLWGTDMEFINQGYTRVFENRGTELILPFDNIYLDNKQKRIFIKTRNYVNFNSNIHLSTFVDCRFLGFFINNGKEFIELS